MYLDEEMIEGAADAIAALKQRGDKVVFLTNKSISTRMDYVQKLRKLGIEVELDGSVDVQYAGTNVLVNRMMAEKDNPQGDVWYGGGGILPYP